MKIAAYYIIATLLALAGIGLFILTNKGILNFGKPYARSISTEISQGSSLVAFENVNVIPMDGEHILKNQTVIIRDGLIEQIGNSGRVETPAGASRIDGHDRYLIPGLVDMHVHIKEENELLLFVANGVTSVRNLWGGTGALRWMGFPDHLQMRAQIESGALLGPSLYTSGPIMEGPPARMPLMPVFASPEAAAESVAWQEEQGYDFIKIYDNLDLETYQAILAAAEEHQLQAVGHVPGQVGLYYVLTAGQATIEHLTGYIDPDSAEYLVAEDKLPEYAALTHKAGVWNCPTIGVYQMHVPNEDLHLLEARTEMAYVSPTMKFLWKYMSRPGAMSSITYEGDYPARINEIYLRTTRILHEGGARFILGTDSDNPYLVPGFSLLDELDYLVEAGFSPYEALESGTRNAAEAMGKLDEFGTLEEGKRADLILLEQNPLDNVSYIRGRIGVMLRGRWLSETELQSMLDGIAASYRPSILERLWPLSILGVAIYLVLHKTL